MKQFAALFGLYFVFVTPFATAQEINIPVFGNWQGAFVSNGWDDYNIRAEIIGQSGSTYKAIFIINGDGMDEIRADVPGKTEKGGTKFAGQVNLGSKLGSDCTVNGLLNKGVFTGSMKSSKGEGKFELKRFLFEPPTRGKKAPEGAIALMWDGMTQEDFENVWHVNPHWRVNANGIAQIHHSNIVTKQAFGDAQYHVEFATPYMPNDRGQARGNSGVYILGKYEVQVLDSFGLPTKDNECGGIYKIATPLVNACLPPLEFQTYDITFHAARFDANGNKTSNATITVIHNGTMIHDNVELPTRTGGGIGGRESIEGPLLIQDHNDQPRFRNIWVKPL